MNQVFCGRDNTSDFDDHVEMTDIPAPPKYFPDHVTIENNEIASLFIKMVQVVNREGPDLVELLGNIYVMKILMKDGRVLPITLDLRNSNGSIKVGHPMMKPTVIVSCDEQTFLDVLNGRTSAYEALS